MHFGNNRIIFHHFPIAWPPRSFDFNPCDFWLRSYLINITFGVPIANLAELKTGIAQHIHNVTIIDTLRSYEEHAFSRFKLAVENGGQHIEHFISKSRDSQKPLSFLLFCGFWPQDNWKPVSLLLFLWFMASKQLKTDVAIQWGNSLSWWMGFPQTHHWRMTWKSFFQ